MSLRTVHWLIHWTPDQRDHWLSRLQLPASYCAAAIVSLPDLLHGYHDRQRIRLDAFGPFVWPFPVQECPLLYWCTPKEATRLDRESWEAWLKVAEEVEARERAIQELLSSVPAPTSASAPVPVPGGRTCITAAGSLAKAIPIQTCRGISPHDPPASDDLLVRATPSTHPCVDPCPTHLPSSKTLHHILTPANPWLPQLQRILHTATLEHHDTFLVLQSVTGEMHQAHIHAPSLQVPSTTYSTEHTTLEAHLSATLTQWFRVEHTTLQVLLWRDSEANSNLWVTLQLPNDGDRTT